MNDEIVVKTYNIDNKEYFVIKELDYNNIHYIIMANDENEKDIMIKKIIDGYLEPLDSEEEINNVLKEIAK